MMRRNRIIWAAAGALVVFCACGAALALKRSEDVWLLHSERLFTFRDAVSAMKTPSQFDRGALAYVFHDGARAERELLPVARSTPWWSHEGFAAAEMVRNIYDLTGRNADAVAQYQSLGWHSLFWDMYFFRTLARYGDLTVAERGESQVPFAVIDNQMYIPLTVNGQPANYQLDTGSSASYLSESEARRLGLKVEPYASKVQGYSQVELVTGLAVAAELSVGDFRLRNVPFLLQNDTVADGDGILGLPVLLALETLEWGSDGMLRIGFASKAPNPGEANLAFADDNILTTAVFGEGHLDFYLDTGSANTRLYPRFRREHAAFMAGQKAASDDSKASRCRRCVCSWAVRSEVFGPRVCCGKIRSRARPICTVRSDSISSTRRAG